MGKTAIVNPRRPRRRYTKRRRSNVETAGANRRRRRYRLTNPETATENRRYRRKGSGRRYYTRRRRRNPDSVARMSNPFMGDLFQELMIAVPPGAASILGTRWAIKMAGEMPKTGKPEWAQAIAAIAWANLGSALIGQVFGDSRAGIIAKIASYSYAGELFARNYIFDKNEWVNSNLYMGQDEYYMMNGLSKESQIGEESPYVVGPDGTVYQVEGVGAYDQPFNYPSIMSDVGGLVQDHALGAEFGPYAADASSSFGYRVK